MMCSPSVIPEKDTTMLEGKGRFTNRPTETGGKLYDKFYIYVPTEVARDGLFPFIHGEEIVIRIDPENQSLIISRSS